MTASIVSRYMVWDNTGFADHWCSLENVFALIKWLLSLTTDLDGTDFWLRWHNHRRHIWPEHSYEGSEHSYEGRVTLCPDKRGKTKGMGCVSIVHTPWILLYVTLPVEHRSWNQSVTKETRCFSLLSHVAPWATTGFTTTFPCNCHGTVQRNLSHLHGV